MHKKVLVESNFITLLAANLLSEIILTIVVSPLIISLANPGPINEVIALNLFLKAFLKYIDHGWFVFSFKPLMQLINIGLLVINFLIKWTILVVALEGIARTTKSNLILLNIAKSFVTI